MDALDKSLGQRSIFDRLTNNGKTQGIYLSGGLLYLNATYMRPAYWMRRSSRPAVSPTKRA